MTPSSPRSTSPGASLAATHSSGRPVEAVDCVATEPRCRYSSAQLLGDSIEVEIEHGAAVYRLRRTALGKLILTK